ncbi:PH domain-containing protein [Halobacillus kuroshimensis]|uniref:PH domain-containing protein n=1 Tax=Halobacillus kuroshimensis TaxID=302481 RepID=A0ABS3E0Z0_9BACI|nr:PH domain-containing protein [Halobacillus kuroshimensis]MBN8237261.1 PH domain-containing protein [Halobacillus kuroshimensis]
MMFEPRKLHPISALINFVKTLKDAALPLIVVIFINGSPFSGDWNWVPLAIWGGLLVIVLGSGVIRWLRFSYWMEDGELRIEYGLIFRKKRYIPVERIQSLDFSEGIFHRPLKLVKVSVETAGATGTQGAEAELTAITREEAKELETLIFQQKRAAQEEETVEENAGEQPVEPPRQKVFGMTMKDLVLMAVTSGGAGVVISGVAVFFSQFMDILPVGAIYEELLDWIQIGVLMVAVTVLFVLLIAYGISILLTIMRYAYFSVYLEEEDLIITRGWLEKKQMTIPLNRIQGVRIDENLIRQPMGYASVTIISAGGSIMKNDEHQLKLLPMIRKKEIEAVLQMILEDYQVAGDFKQPPARSKYRYMIRQSWLGVLAAIPISIYFYPYGLLAVPAVAALAGFGLLAYKDAGWTIDGTQLSLRSRNIIKQTYLMKRFRIQAASKKQTLLQKRSGLSTIQVTLTSGGGGAVARCYYLEEKDTDSVMGWYIDAVANQKPVEK